MRIANAASPALLARLADKHDLSPRASGPPALTAGSDDHALLSAAGTWTETPAARSREALLDRLWAGAVAPGGAHGSATHLAQSVGTLPLKRYLNDGAPGLPEALRALLADLVQHPAAAATPSAGAHGAAPGAMAAAGAQVLRRIRGDRAFVRTVPPASAANPTAPTGPTSGCSSRRHGCIARRWRGHSRPTVFSLWTLGTRVDSLGAGGGAGGPILHRRPATSAARNATRPTSAMRSSARR